MVIQTRLGLIKLLQSFELTQLILMKLMMPVGASGSFGGVVGELIADPMLSGRQN